MRKTIEQRLAQLEEQKKALKARLGKMERAQDTRRKILLGALVLHRLQNGNDSEFSRRLGDWLARELPAFLTRDEDKQLFAGIIAAPQAQNTTANPPAEHDALISPSAGDR